MSNIDTLHFYTKLQNNKIKARSQYYAMQHNLEGKMEAKEIKFRRKKTAITVTILLKGPKTQPVDGTKMGKIGRAHV